MFYQFYYFSIVSHFPHPFFIFILLYHCSRKSTNKKKLKINVIFFKKTVDKRERA
nr:MAG TPA: hypothetical protein [Caudoviricetes sp.]